MWRWMVAFRAPPPGMNPPRHHVRFPESTGGQPVGSGRQPRAEESGIMTSQGLLGTNYPISWQGFAGAIKV